jgi:hemerythrin-like domain-containing protein
MSAAINYWRAEHASFAHLLDLFEKKLGAFQTCEQPDYEIMLEIVDYLRHFPNRYHHAREDVAFACISSRDPSLASQVERMRLEHRQLAAAGEALHFVLSGALDGAILVRKAIQAAAEDYLGLYRQHLASEERILIPRAQELLTPEDWKEVARAVPPGVDPLFGEDADNGYRELRRQIAMEAARAA